MMNDNLCCTKGPCLHRNSIHEKVRQLVFALLVRRHYGRAMPVHTGVDGQGMDAYLQRK